MAAEINVPDSTLAAAASPVVLCSLNVNSSANAGEYVIPAESLRLYGWAVASQTIVSVVISINGIPLNAVQFGLDRPDVARANPAFPNALRSGFACESAPFPNTHAETIEITVIVTLASGYIHRLVRSPRVLRSAADIISTCRHAGTLTPDALTTAARILAENRHFGEAESLSAVAAMRFPDDLGALCGYASVETQVAAARQETGNEALRRWRIATLRFPDSPLPRIGEAKTMIALRRIDEAEAMLTSIQHQWPDLQETEALYAHLPIQRAVLHPIADRRQFYIAAQDRWALFRGKYPDHPVGYMLGADVHSLCNEFSVAETLVAEAMERFPDHSDAAVRYAAIATMRGNPAEALRRWRTARESFPNMPVHIVWEERAHNEMIGEEDIEPESDHPAASPVSPDHTIAMLFESLGFNCEFGVVQRHFGAEPLGLLRFASLTLDDLIQALDARFDGVGEPENTLFELRQHPTLEYWLSDKRFNLLMHTFMYPENLLTEKQRLQAFEKHCRRLRYLAVKLILDLQSAEKILVFQINRTITRHELQALFAAVRRYGPNTLLCVDPADPGQQPGSVEIIEPGLLRGHLRSFCYADTGSKFDIENWQSICRQAHAIWLAGRLNSLGPLRDAVQPAT